MKDDGETLTPVEGVVYMGIQGYQNAPVDPTPISKSSLFDLCMESKWNYDAEMERIQEMPEMSLAEFSKLRSLIEE